MKPLFCIIKDGHVPDASPVDEHQASAIMDITSSTLARDLVGSYYPTLHPTFTLVAPPTHVLVVLTLLRRYRL